MDETRNTSTIENTGGLEAGDIITFSGQYKKRTFWQYITLRPRQLEKFLVTDVGLGGETTIGFI